MGLAERFGGWIGEGMIEQSLQGVVVKAAKLARLGPLLCRPWRPTLVFRQRDQVLVPQRS